MVAHTPVRTDAAVIALVGMVHATSHLFHLLLPPLFPLLMPDFGFGYTEKCRRRAWATRFPCMACREAWAGRSAQQSPEWRWPGPDGATQGLRRPGWPCAPLARCRWRGRYWTMMWQK